MGDTHIRPAWLVHWDMLVGYNARVKDLTIKPVMADTLHNVHLTWIGG